MRKICIWVFAVLLSTGLLTGCSAGKEGDGAHSSIDFTVVELERIPEELAAVIEENKKNEIRMSYTDGEDMYLIRGYGEQKSGGYSIEVAQCWEDEEGIWLDTRLIGPRSQENLSKDPSYPCLVVKIEARDKEVMIN